MWCFRDIRFIIYESQLEDFRAGSSMSDDQWDDRVRALEILEMIVEEADPLFAPEGLETCGTCGRSSGVRPAARVLGDWEEDALDQAFARQRSLREGPTLDEMRVRDALRQQADVLLTNDHQLARRVTGRLPLSLMRPADLVQALYVSGEIGSGRFNLSDEVLALPAQDPHKLTHLLGLLRDRA